MRAFAGLGISLCLLLAACNQAPSVTPPNAAQPNSSIQVLGTLELNVDTTLGGQAVSSGVIPGMSLTRGESAVYEDAFYRYVSVDFVIRNLSSTPRSNVTLLAIGTDATIPGSPYRVFRDENGEGLDSAIAADIRPSHGFVGPGVPDTSVTRASFQAYEEGDVSQLNGIRDIKNAFPWGYVATREDGGRTLGPNGTANATANFTLAVRVPKATNVASLVMAVAVVTDSEIRTTRDVVERNKDLDGNGTATRANALSVANGGAPVTVATMPGDLAITSCASCVTTNIMNVRTMGTQTAASVRLLDPAHRAQVALTGEAVANLGGSTFDALSATPNVNDAGQVAFYSTLMGSATRGVFLKSAEDLAPSAVAWAGQEAPEAGGATYNTFGTSPVLNPAGQLVFSSVLNNGRTAIFVGTPDAVTPVVIQGQAAPGTAGSTFNVGLNNFVSNAAGQVAFYSPPDSSSTTELVGIFSGQPGDLTRVVVSGDSTPVGGTYSFPSPVTPTLNNGGDVAFVASITGSSRGNGGVFLQQGGAVAPVALRGTTGQQFSSFNTNPPALNDVGQVAFLGTLSGGGLAVAMGTPDSLTILARQNAQAPNASGAVYGALGAPAINGNGQVAFQANLSGGTTTAGIFLGTPDSVQMVALQGSPAPDAPGLTLGAFGTTVALNDSGQVAFTTTLSGNGQALYVGTPENLRLVARKGDQIDTNPSPDIETLKTVNSISFTSGSGGQDGRAMGLAADGTITFRVTFSDNSTGVYTLR
ncbi:DUF7453 family protein [Deinococcus humi]|uniref:Uncharacterized protein n=1 Tax=Deinococcus humi TaxID=662880 RepID=A0A7W8JZR9_9DEIO|nr:choice-of-anchor tandem repeat NxxGxxAF-containing protein [Deinococcus humi]MBB5364614.1 hypothetical protein [Deinococcus humi]GGO39177.1 hypothetical protein GCM10008949_46860 [Deinococcus humi]